MHPTVTLALGNGSALWHTVRAYGGTAFLIYFLVRAVIYFARDETGALIKHLALAAVVAAIVYTPTSVVSQLQQFYAQALS